MIAKHPIMEDGLRSPRVRFKDGNQTDGNDDVFDVRRNMQSSSHSESEMSLQRGYRNYSPNNTGPQNALNYSPKYNRPNISPTYSQHSSSSVIEKYTQPVKETSIIGELKFLEESNTNLLIELRECQDSNYVLTEELRRSQRSNINVLDELQACQTANMVLRNELQRLEIDNTKVNRELDKYKKANKILKEDIKEFKTRHWKRRDSTRALKEKAKDIVTQYDGTEGNTKGISSLKDAIDSFAESIETESLNGYLPTDSDSMSERQSSNSDIEENELMNGTPRVRGRREFVRSQSNDPPPRYHEEQNGLFGRKKLANMAEQRQQQQQPREQTTRVMGRRAGSLENLLDIDKKQSLTNGHFQNSQYINRNGKPSTPSNNRKTSGDQRMTPSPKNASHNSLRMSNQEMSTSNTWQL